MLSRLPASPLCRSIAPLTGPLCSVALLVALPLMMGRLSSPALVRSFQPACLRWGTVAKQQAFGSPVPDVYRMTPERRALLNTIRFAEGTWTNGRGDGYSSAAAGAYQFLPATWNEARRSGVPWSDLIARASATMSWPC